MISSDSAVKNRFINRRSDCYFFLWLLGHDAYAYGPCKNIDVAERDDGLLAGFILAKKSENIGIAMLDSTDVCDYPLASAVGLANDTLSDKILKLAPALLEIRTDNHNTSSVLEIMSE